MAEPAPRYPSPAATQLDASSSDDGHECVTPSGQQEQRFGGMTQKLSRLRKFAQLSTDVLLVCTRDDRQPKLLLSPMCVDILGFGARRQLQGVNCSMLLVAPDRVGREACAAARGGECAPLEFRLKASDGTEVRVATTVQRCTRNREDEESGPLIVASLSNLLETATLVLEARHHAGMLIRYKAG